MLERHEQVLRERVRLATWQMTTLYEVGKAISANLELEPRLTLICSNAAELTGRARPSSTSTIPTMTGITAAAAYGLEWSLADVQSSRLAAGTPLGKVAIEHEPWRTAVKLGHGTLVIPGFPSVRPYSLLAVPMIADGQGIGALVALDKPEGFDAGDENYLVLFASQAAIAVRNSQLFEHTKSLDRLKSEFVAVVSHEIRTPLTSVKGAVELLSDARYFKNTDQQSKLLSIAHANAERLLRLINDILDFSKLDSSSLPMTFEHQRLEPIVEQAAHNLRTLLEEHQIELAVRLPDDLPDLPIDAHRIAQVLTNLMSNAIKFSAEGGKIEIGAARDPDQLRVWVRDHGEGIAPQDLQQAVPQVLADRLVGDAQGGRDRARPGDLQGHRRAARRPHRRRQRARPGDDVHVHASPPGQRRRRAREALSERVAKGTRRGPVILIEMIDALGSADADARVRAQAMRRAGPAVRATALPWRTPAERHESAEPPSLAEREERFRRAVHNACAAFSPECVVLAASEPVAARLKAHVPRETPLRWWPTAVLDLAARNGSPLAPLALAARGAGDARDETALPALDVAVIRAPRSGERVSLWDGTMCSCPASLGDADGREILKSFAHVDEAALDLVVLAAPQPEFIAPRASSASEPASTSPIPRRAMPS